jgi:hypothetical protein
VLERIVINQLSSFLYENNILHPAQHGFRSGRSTLTNLLVTDAAIAQLISDGHSVDIITFDFAKAVDKASHYGVIKALYEHGIRGAALKWFESFLSERTQQVRVGDYYSSVSDVTSGVVQGSVVGPGIYTVFVNSLFARLHLPVGGFADDIKFIADVTIHGAAYVQSEIDEVVKWSDENCSPLSIDKCGVLHCGALERNNTYYIKGSVLKSLDSFKDLGVIRTTNTSHSAHYQEHYKHIVSKAARMSGCIRHIFHSRKRELLWPAFQIYVQPILMYCSSAWCPALKRDINTLEAVQRRYTKCIYGLKDLPYDERLRELGSLSLENKRLFADMTLVYKCLHHQMNCSAIDIGLSFRSTKTRGGCIHLEQHITKQAHAAYFCNRVPPLWNKLKLLITGAPTLPAFKKQLFTFLIKSQ